jgi:hypothetical protein
MGPRSYAIGKYSSFSSFYLIHHPFILSDPQLINHSDRLKAQYPRPVIKINEVNHRPDTHDGVGPPYTVVSCSVYFLSSLGRSVLFSAH